LRHFSFGGYGLALAALALMVFGAIECPPPYTINSLNSTRDEPFWEDEGPLSIEIISTF